LEVAVALDAGFQPPRSERELAVLLQSIDSLLADYLRRSLVNGSSSVPLSDVIRDLHALLGGAGHASAGGANGSLQPAATAAARFRRRRRAAS
jgi:hypothetical protein